MAAPLEELVSCWMDWGGIDVRLRRLIWPRWIRGFAAGNECCRPGADPRVIADWEDRHGYRLPPGLRAWLMLSNGLFGAGPVDPSDLRDRPHDSVCPCARYDRSARELV